MVNETSATGLLNWIEISGDVGDWTSTDALNDPRMWENEPIKC